MIPVYHFPSEPATPTRSRGLSGPATPDGMPAAVVHTGRSIDGFKQTDYLRALVSSCLPALVLSPPGLGSPPPIPYPHRKQNG